MDKSNAVSLIEQYPKIIIFDGVCNLCSGWVQFLIKRDPGAKFMFCSVQSREGIGLLAYLGLPTDRIETMAYIDRGRVYLRSTAFFEVMKELPAIWPLLSAGLFVPQVIRDPLYSLIAKNRYRIAGKKYSCFFPTDDIRARFVEWNTTSY